MAVRLNKFFKVLRKERISAFLTADSFNISYLTGFRSDVKGYLAVIPGQKPIFFTHFIFENEAKAIKIWDLTVIRKNAYHEICVKLKTKGIVNLTIDFKGFNWQNSTQLTEIFASAGIKLTPKADLIENLRVIKDSREIGFIRNSRKITTQALSFIDQIVDSAMTEKTLCIEIEKFMRLKGDNQIAFPGIVANGKNCAYPHHDCGNDFLFGPVFLIDLGAKYHDYCADLTRVFFSGKIPRLLTKIFDVVRKAQELGINAAKSGVKACDVDKAGREYIVKQGFGKYFGHGLGHGIGLEVHEAPYLNPRDKTILKQGMVVTIEPAIYIPGKFGVRWEDMILITDSKAEII